MESGLLCSSLLPEVIHAERYQVLMDLRWQQDTFRVVREYLVLVHGDVKAKEAMAQPREDAMDAMVLEDRLEEVEGGCRISEVGRPSRTLLRALATYRAPAAPPGAKEGAKEDGRCGHSCGDRRFSLLCVEIVTGRRHQIRVQLAARGHPVVGDGRYGDVDSLCPRLFLHRHRLAFQSQGEQQVVTEQLPEDLCTALDTLELVQKTSLNSELDFLQQSSAWHKIGNLFGFMRYPVKSLSCQASVSGSSRDSEDLRTRLEQTRLLM